MKKKDYKKIYAKLSPQQKRSRLDWKKKKYHSDPEYRRKNIEGSKKYLASRSPEKKQHDVLKSREYGKVYVKKISKKFDETRDIKIYFKFKRRNIQRSARTRKLEFNLTVQDFLDTYEQQKGKCYYTDTPLVLKIYSGMTFEKENMDKFKNYLSVDRTDPNKGYIKGNVRFVTFEFNTMKGKLTIAKLKEFAKKIIEKT